MMEQYRRIVAAIDFSGYTKRVARHAVTMARALDAELTIVNVINQKEIDIIYTSLNRMQKRDFHRVSVQTCVDQLEEERQEEFKKLEKEVDFSDVTMNFIIKTGVPYKEILDVISEEKVDLAVLGVKGRSELADVIVGSTALKLFRRSPVPLITIRERGK
jgi:nucleotide-binding universal stress UspA family protein